jgi:hypothetical protein
MMCDDRLEKLKREARQQDRSRGSWPQEVRRRPPGPDMKDVIGIDLSGEEEAEDGHEEYRQCILRVIWVTLEDLLTDDRVLPNGRRAASRILGQLEHLVREIEPQAFDRYGGYDSFLERLKVAWASKSVPKDAMEVIDPSREQP